MGLELPPQDVDRLSETLALLPSSPGVYIFRAADKSVLYVGKAVSLRSRVRSYFQLGSSDTRAFIPRLAEEVADIETLVARSEREAMLLENNLIKELQPRYNVKLRDDKEYLSLRLDPKQKWPRLEVVRRPGDPQASESPPARKKADTASYFGPYHSATAARQTLRLVNRHFQLRTCTDSEFALRTRPCLQYQIKRCPAPCALPVDSEDYARQVKQVAWFLRGEYEDLSRDLAQQMTDAAQKLEYERAARFRDLRASVEQTQEAQRVSSSDDVDQDVFAVFTQDGSGMATVARVRQGRLVGMDTHDLKHAWLPDDELLASFVSAYYERLDREIPDEVLVAEPIEATEALAEALSERHAARRVVRVSSPERGQKRRLVDLAIENAAHSFRERAQRADDIQSRLDGIARALELTSPPRLIECIDISHTGGEDTVAAIVCLRDGKPDKKRYRSFNVRDVRDGNDYGAMYEVLMRRFRRGRDAKPGEAWSLPDLLVVDGGRGQLNVALAARRDAGVPHVAVVGLAKEKDNTAGERQVDRVFRPGEKTPISIKQAATGLSLLALARDEAHRFANALRMRLGKSKRFQTRLDAVPGVGIKTRRLLLRNLGSATAVQAADVATLVASGASTKQAEAIYTFFRARSAELATNETSEATARETLSADADARSIPPEGLPDAPEPLVAAADDTALELPASQDRAEPVEEVGADAAIDNAFAALDQA